MLTVASPEKKAGNVEKPGAPDENIVQNHLNIALLGIFLSSKNFSSVRIS